MELFAVTGEGGIFEGFSVARTRESNEAETMTEEIEYVSRGMNTRPLKSQETQVESQKQKVKDSGDTVGFMQKVEEVMNKELGKTSKAFQYYQVDWSIETPPVVIHTYSGPKIEEVKKTQATDDYFSSGGMSEKALEVSSVSWNNKGYVIAVGYAYSGHLGWCSHRSFIRIWSLSSAKQEEFEIEGCVSSLAFSPSASNILAVGSYNGVLLLLNTDEGNFYQRSSIDEYQHREAITQITWVSTLAYSLFTLSTDGKMLNWNPENLEFPIRGALIKGRHELEGGTSFTVTEDHSSLILASESGKVFKYALPILITHPLPLNGLKIKPEAEVVLNNLHSTYRQQIIKAATKYCMENSLKEIDLKSLFFHKPDIMKCYPSSMSLNYESHDGPVTSVSCNPFHRNLFATSSTDSSVKIFNALQVRAILLLEPVFACKIHRLAWSETRPLVLAVGSDNGSVYIYDFLQSKTHFVLEIENSRNSVSYLEFNKSVKDYLAVGYKSGEVRVYQLPGVFNVAHPDEGRQLILMLEEA